MQWARVRTSDGRELVGVIEGDSLHPRAHLGSTDRAGAPVALVDTERLPPCVPGKFIGLLHNFHAGAQRNGWEIPEHPLYFLMPTTSLAGAGATVTMFEEALEAAIGRCRYGRGAGRKGYRHGHRSRELVGTFGTETVQVPRAPPRR